jgi:hypothetical protein
MIGDFKDGRGEFFDQEEFNGRMILARNGFSNITPNSSRFEQAFSDDEGKHWGTNWLMTFTRQEPSKEKVWLRKQSFNRRLLKGTMPNTISISISVPGKLI